MTTDERPLVILQPAQQRGERIFTAAAPERAGDRLRVVDLENDHDAASFDPVLPDASAITGQPDLPAERLLSAPKPQPICNDDLARRQQQDGFHKTAPIEPAAARTSPPPLRPHDVAQTGRR